MNAANAIAKRNNEWSETQRIYMVWQALPRPMREPKTQQEFADMVGVDVVTLWRWRQIPAFQEEVGRIMHDALRDAMPEVLDTIRRKAIDGYIEFVNLYLSLNGGAQAVAGANATLTINQNQMTEDEATTLLERSLGLQLTARVTSDDKH